MPKLFISYRRQDTADATGRLYDRLKAHFGPDSVFYDVDNIPVGTDFRKHIGEQVGRCDIFLAIIGDHWLGICYEDGPKQGQRRLDDPDDWVRIEIEAAMARGVPVIPVLVARAKMPREADLPSSLQDLVFRQNAEVRSDGNYDGYTSRLIRAIEAQLSPADERSSNRKNRPASRPINEHVRVLRSFDANSSLATVSRTSATDSAAGASGDRSSLRAAIIFCACLYGLLTLSSLFLYLFFHFRFNFHGFNDDLSLITEAVLNPFIFSLLQAAFVFTAGTHDLLNPIRFSRRCPAILLAGSLIMVLYMSSLIGIRNLVWRTSEMGWVDYDMVPTVSQKLSFILFICWLVWIVTMVIRSAKWSRMLFFTRMCQHLGLISLVQIAVEILKMCFKVWYPDRFGGTGMEPAPEGILIGIGPAAFWLLMNRAVRKSEREDGS